MDKTIKQKELEEKLLELVKNPVFTETDKNGNFTINAKRCMYLVTNIAKQLKHINKQ